MILMVINIKCSVMNNCLLGLGGNSKWIGAKRLARSKSFFWVDGSLMDWQAWNKEEPSDSYSKEDCVEMNAEKEFKWNDISCSTKRDFFCSVPNYGHGTGPYMYSRIQI